MLWFWRIMILIALVYWFVWYAVKQIRISMKCKTELKKLNIWRARKMVEHLRFKGKYVVIKVDDIENYVDSYFEMTNLTRILDHINFRRKEDKVPNDNLIIIDMDVPYRDEIIEVIKNHGDWEKED